VVTDPIADMFTRIRNAGRARLAQVAMPSSRIRREIARVLKEAGFVSEVRTDTGADARKPVLLIELRYGEANRSVIENIERISRPGRRVYVRADQVQPVRAGAGIAILSTPRGIVTDEQARAARVGGELLGRVW
jgi:small subunit ribosomal protein S8